MAAAANYARANRQLLADAARRASTGHRCADLDLVYDVSHNLAKLEHHEVDGDTRLLCVHRKGATRALPPGHPELPDRPAARRAAGARSPARWAPPRYVLAGVAGGDAFHSTCHGAGRTMSRHAAARQRPRAAAARTSWPPPASRCAPHSDRGLAEEAPFSYKDVDEVVATCEQAGLARRVARLRPIGVVKG